MSVKIKLKVSLRYVSGFNGFVVNVTNKLKVSLSGKLRCCFQGLELLGVDQIVDLWDDQSGVVANFGCVV